MIDYLVGIIVEFLFFICLFFFFLNKYTKSLSFKADFCYYLATSAFYDDIIVKRGSA